MITKQMTGTPSDVLVEQLVASGVKYVFYNSGSREAPFFDALHERSDIDGILALHEGSVTAMAGGYTTVCVMSDANKPLDSPESIKYIVDKSKELPISILPIGSLSVNHKGKELCEFGHMVQEGAVAFSDSETPIRNSQFLRYALEYCKMLDIPVINHAEDIHLTMTKLEYRS